MGRPGRNVYIGGRWYGPSYPGAGEPPARGARPVAGDAPSVPAADPPKPPPAVEKPAEPVTEADVDEPELAAGVDAPDPPPRYGKGSGNTAWRDWAREVGLDLTAVGNDDAKRDQIIAAAQAAGILAAS